MIFGHAGVAFGARAARPQLSLALLIVAAFAPDLLDAAYAFAGICNPFGVYSHSLPAVALLAVTLGALAWRSTRSRSAALIVAGVVASHLVLDFVTGEKLLWLHGPLAGFHVYRWPMLDYAIETPLIVAGWWILRRSRFPARWVVSWWTLGILIAAQGAVDYTIRASSAPYLTRCELRGLGSR